MQKCQCKKNCVCKNVSTTKCFTNVTHINIDVYSFICHHDNFKDHTNLVVTFCEVNHMHKYFYIFINAR